MRASLVFNTARNALHFGNALFNSIELLVLKTTHSDRMSKMRGGFGWLAVPQLQ